ncbi:MAG TPA: NAD(P)/FAD-dependent oxidoreductase [Candidatus Binatia bacterium]|nr:NAD(P)/FAD-dependent oxidoreductase [Candidatus Binatia bacterium]
MAEEREYDVVVVGGGSTGENVANRVVKGGLSAVVVEEDLVGGDCSYWACMPSKALLRPMQAVAAARRVAGARQAVSGRIDAPAVLERRDGFTHHWDDSGQARWLEGAHIDLVRGHGRLAGARRVEVSGPSGSVTLAARQAVALSTGSEPALPPVPGLAESEPWTTKSATSAKSRPARLVVLGGGVAGCELSQAWRSLGSEVTLVEMSDRLLSIYDPVAGQLVADSMGEMGIEVRCGVSAERVTGGRGSPVTVHLGDGSSVEGDVLLVAAGRRPRTRDLGLDTVGLEPGSWLQVDDSLTVAGVEGGWLYAAGDLNHRALLTHMGKYQGRICGDAIVARSQGRLETGSWSRHRATADHRAVPQVVFTDPEVAAVGLSEARAREAGLRVRAVDYEIGDVAGASLLADGYRGHARMVVDEERRVVVGVTLVGQDVGELIHAATVAVAGEVPLERLWHAVPSYPTMSELWLRLLETYGL